MAITEEQAVLAILRDAAQRGVRCPTNPEIAEALIKFGFPTWPKEARVHELAYAGFLKVEVYDQNYRVVEIDGMRTKAARPGWQPYAVISGGKRKTPQW